MKEIKEIIGAFEKATGAGHRAALATVVHVDGSSYRRPGARMLVTDDGALTGAISGGCLEGDALTKALFAVQRQQSMLVTYDTMDEDDAKLGVGLGCNGIIQVLFEPIDAANPDNPIALLKRAASKRQQSVLVTLFSLQRKRDPQIGTCMLLGENGKVCTLDSDNELVSFIQDDALEAMGKRNSTFRNYVSHESEVTAFVEYIKPPASLVIFGAGNDVVPLVQMAEVLGWETTVIDGRANLAKQDRFASSCQVVVSRPEEALKNIDIDEQTVFLLMTHNYNYDLAMLRELLKKDVRYIGSLGPRHKTERMLEELSAEGIRLPAEQAQHIFGPAGLDIGAETPEEIALSILSEIQAVLADREGALLRKRDAVIHPRENTLIEKVNISKKAG